ncbi:hypothetical protein B0A49_01450 [Cryomyces minteri]|uniref:MalT-like TPR region domain-containing protein n=1 Tax=Cryomyces minteri TaxID=331657 RepID=A0A4U0XKT0_9PEZI|nr:hypothetical protein B0A49_01450 [Cryomyces minteri]
MTSSISSPQSPAKSDNNFWGSLPPGLHDAAARALPADKLRQMIQRLGNQDVSTNTHDQAHEVSLEQQAKLNALDELLLHTVQTRQQTLGREHEDTLEAMHALAMVQTELRHCSQAETTYRQLLEAHERTMGPDKSWAVSNNLGLVLNQQKKYAEAEAILRPLLPRLQGRMGKDSPQALGCLRHLMEAVGGQGRYKEAEEMNVKGFELARGMGGEHRPAEMEAMQEMAAQLEEWKPMHETLAAS